MMSKLVPKFNVLREFLSMVFRNYQSKLADFGELTNTPVSVPQQIPLFSGRASADRLIRHPRYPQ